MAENKPMLAVAVIRRYFFPVDAKAADILAEVKKLSAKDKAELAEGAAKELGVTLAEAAD